MYYSQSDIEKIKEAASDHLFDFLSDYVTFSKSPSAASHVADCPVCGKRKGFQYHPGKKTFACFSCHKPNGNNAITYLMSVENKSYIEALDLLVRRFNIIVDTPQPKPKKPAVKMKKSSKASKGQNVDTYCARMLAESGLTYADVTAKVYKSDDKRAIFESKTFKPGTLNDKGEIVEGDDVIIEYYDLDGNPVTYERRDAKGKLTGKYKEYYRVRWQYPEAHLDKNGKPFKYKSPPGSGTPIYIPERLRKMYQEGVQIPRLYVQEGEKKAEKACKHGIPSIAISGIQNIANKATGSLPEDMVRIITHCKVKEVALLFDSDWQNLSSNIKINDKIEQRPLNFYFAAKNFKEYLVMLKNRDIYVDVFIGHVKDNEAGDKGVDDLLANMLRDNENELASDIEYAVNDKKHQGKHVEMFKISDWSDNKLKELWSLQSPQTFAERHKELLQNLPEFLYGRYRWKFDDTGKLVFAQPFDEDEKFWVDVTKKDTVVPEYDYVNGKNFFQNRGIGRYRLLDGNWSFIHLAPPIVRTITVDDARDFIFSFAESYCNRDVNQMLLKGGVQYVGPFQMGRLEFIYPNFVKATRDIQYFYFDKACWRVTQGKVEEIGYESITHHIWQEQKKEMPAQYLGKPLVTFSKNDKNYAYKVSAAGEACHFLQFLINASNFTWRKQPEDIDPEEQNENNIHLLSKLCAIGYMAMECKDANVSRAVVGMDGKQSEVGESNGRSGKSLIGELIRHVMPIAYIPGKKRDLLDDQFIWNDIADSTRLVFIDDVLQNFNFEFLFPHITGDWSVNYKGGRRVTYPNEKSPKIYIATNHALRGSGGSFTDRQWLLAFSDFYNEEHKPVDDFGVLFFKEWDYNQWNLCWNLIANCVQLYLTYGVVQAPGERLEQRKLRQEMGETFISWADEYFSAANRLNARLIRQQLFNNFIEYDPGQRKFVTPTEFKSRIKKYCEWKGFVFNPGKYDPRTGKPFQCDKDGKPVVDDKTGGVEYFTIGAKNIPIEALEESQPEDKQPKETQLQLEY